MNYSYMIDETFVKDVVQPYSQELGLEWPIVYIPNTGGLIGIFSDAYKHQHNIFYNERAGNRHALQSFDAENPVHANLVHELCHAHLGETIDPLFSGSRFSKCYDALEGEKAHEATTLQSNHRYLDNSIADIWVNDVFHDKWPGLFEMHNRNYAKQAVRLAKMGRWDMLGPSVIPFSLAKQRAESIRHGLTPLSTAYILTELQSQHPHTYRDILSLQQYWQTVPRLSYNPEKDLTLYEATFNRSAELISLTVRRRLSEEDGLHIWTLFDARHPEKPI